MPASLGFAAKLEWDFSLGAFPDRTTDSESVARLWSARRVNCVFDWL